MDISPDYAVKRKRKLKEPPDYKVILLNDNFTTMEFVVEVLISIFHKSEEAANIIMLDIHEKGSGVAGVYTKDIAFTKVQQVTAMAAENDFPLKCIAEKAA
ncbi:MAG: ATP-dependent Clp protease adapter ClpS [Termitinemataceae bacterium]|nr:MAG: ATP-dependent Clp protease adapter ClpS [Termitinemataceae bacterium]